MLVKIHAGTDGTCASGADGEYVEADLGLVPLSPGDTIALTYPAPLVVKASAGAMYCLGLSASHYTGTQTTLYFSTVQLTAFVVAGTYTGAGTDAAAGRVATAAPTLQTR